MAAPVKHTCPDIDRAIKHLKDAKWELRAAIDDNSIIWSIESEIDNAIGYFEDLRKSNDELRQWGEELDKELQSAGNTIADMEDKISELEKQEV